MASASYHYTRAEKLLAEIGTKWFPNSDAAISTAVAAQAHATLALVAVQAEASRGAVVMLDMHGERRTGGAS